MLEKKPALTGSYPFRHNQGVWLEDGWFNTGDLGRQDAYGTFWLTGRKKELILLDEVPLTLVGKIFKPALRWDAIRRVYEAELQALGDLAESVKIEVTEDKVHGCLATISVEPAAGTSKQEIEDRVEAILTRYTIRYELEVS